MGRVVGRYQRRFVPGESTTLWRVLGHLLPVARVHPLAKSAACHVARVSSDAYIARLSLFYPGKSAGRSKFPPPTAFRHLRGIFDSLDLEH